MIGGGILAALLFAACLMGSSPGRAEESPPSWVGRISAVDGTVAVRPAGGGWGDSGVNEPIAAGMAVRTAAQGRVRLRIGADAVALAPDSEIDIAQLDAGGTQLVLRHGRIGVRLSRLDAARSIEIDIPPGGVWLLTPGEYDISAGDERAAARVAVLDGRARFAGKGVDSAVEAGSTAVLSGADPVTAATETAAPDAFAQWWRAAAEPADRRALEYVSAAMTGYDALDAHGTWRTIAGIGPVWEPNAVPEDWAPYRFGHWRHIQPWGWTWIDDMPWGFAPSHYGRWTRIRGRDDDEPEHWAWVPGKIVADPAYMPAAVAFLGTAGVGLSYPDAFSPAVAWFPLAPGEIYWPDYTDDLAAIRRINVAAVDDAAAIDFAADGDPASEIVHGDYLYRSFATVVPRSVFVAGRPVAPALVQLPSRRLANAPLLTGSPGIAAAGPRPAVLAAIGGRGHRVKLARAVHTLARIMKPHEAKPDVKEAKHDVKTVSRAAALVRSVSVPTKHVRAARHRPAHARAAGRTAHHKSGKVQLAADRRR
jgi:hypothetical protein